MSANAPTLDNPLTVATQKLGLICERRLLTSPIDVGSVERILVHITNINASVLASTRDHVNASKRLNDFALTLERIARKAESPNEELNSLMASVASNLRAGSQELAAADAVPRWQESMAHEPQGLQAATAE